MTLERRIVEYLGNCVSNRTNQELALEVGAPEPSVRRATCRLVRQGRIRADGTFMRATTYVRV